MTKGGLCLFDFCFFFIISVSTIVSNLYCVTFNISLANSAEIDIQVAKEEFSINRLPFSTFNLESTKVIARFSLLLTIHEKILLWQKLYSKFLFDIFVRPEDRFTRPVQLDNPTTITLTPAEIQQLARNNITQIFVVVRQRLYKFDPNKGRVVFSRFEYLMRQFVSINATISVVASGFMDGSASGSAS